MAQRKDLHPYSPFPKKLPNGREVIDEECSCGHRRTAHSAGGGLAMGHGDCCLCRCEKFTWMGWVYRDGDAA